MSRTDPLIRIDLVKGLAVGFVIANPCVQVIIGYCIWRATTANIIGG